MNYGEVLTRAWNVIWKYKILWLFGFFASLGAGGSSGGGNFNYSFQERDFSNGAQNIPPWMQQLFENPVVWIALVIGVLLLIAVMVVLNTFGKIGLARGAWLADETLTNGTGARLSFGELWQVGTHYFWRILLLILLLWAVTVTLAIIIIIPVVGLSVITMGIGLICLLPLLCLLFVGFWVLTVLADLAVISIVNEDRGLMDAITRCWTLLKARPADIIIMAVILWLGSLVIGFIVGLPTLLILAPLFGGIFTQSEELIRGGAVFSVVLLCLYLPIVMLVQSVMQSYINTAWTLVYRRLNQIIAGQAQPQVITVTPGPEL